MNCFPLSFPILNQISNQRIIDCYMDNLGTARHPNNLLESNYRNLSEFENKSQFFKSLFTDTLEDIFLEHMTIQRITGKFFAPHRDVHRTVTAMYTVKGPAETVFYGIDKKEPVEIVKMSLNRWYLFNNSAFHGVKNIEGDDRITLVIDLTDIFKTFDRAAHLLNAKGLL